MGPRRSASGRSEVLSGVVQMAGRANLGEALPRASTEARVAGSNGLLPASVSLTLVDSL